VRAIAFESVSKTYPIYAAPGDRLREFASPGRRSYHRDFRALNDVSFEVGRGEVFCVIGENGAGKSTLLQLAAGILEPTSGSVTAAGRISALLELGAGFDGEFTGRDNVRLSGAISGFSGREIDQRFAQIEEFAEIGEFIDRPLKTYSSGMVVRLAFAVAIHADPEILLVDEALSVGDVYFRQKCMRKVHELRSRGVTILFVSHALADVSAIGDRTLWLDRGSVRELGDTETVVAKYMEAMARSDAAYAERRRSVDPAEPRSLEPTPVDRIPNVDHRHGDGRARIAGIALVDENGDPLAALQPSSRVVVRIAVRAGVPIRRPVVGFLVRNHLGIDFAATDSAREGAELPALAAGDTLAVDFHMNLPELYPGSFSFSPAVADGAFEPSAMCDWIDNAVTVQMAAGEKRVYGYTHVPCRIELNTKLAGASPRAEVVS
jgi:ABC-type polysaccharide/polyol phosphate transport system ATPase subunit